MIRVLSGAVLVVLATLTVWVAPPPVFYGVAVILAMLAAHEVVGLARATGLTVPRILSELASGLMVLAAAKNVESEVLSNFDYWEVVSLKTLLKQLVRVTDVGVFPPMWRTDAGEKK